MAEHPNKVLLTMRDRLLTALVNGPSMNCRPHNSRQRLDVLGLRALDAEAAPGLLPALLSSQDAFSISATHAAPANKDRARSETDEETDRDPRRAPWLTQQSCLSKLRLIAEEARTYEDDTGAHVLAIGFPLLSMPPGAAVGGGGIKGERRLLAPIAFVNVSLAVRSGGKPGVTVSSRGDDVDRVEPNAALLAWLERQTGKPLTEAAAALAERPPWEEMVELTKLVCDALQIPHPPFLSTDPSALPLIDVPKTDELAAEPSILCAGVLGLFPLVNQSLLRDTEQLAQTPALPPSLTSFVRAATSAAAASAAPVAGPAVAATPAKDFAQERIATSADPFQARAVRLARSCDALVIHGPPGTGKSQTITNIIADHLARGERVLFVCDKRTALDVVAHRLDGLGLAPLCAVVHDPQRDQRHLYLSIRQQLEELAESRLPDDPTDELQAADRDLAALHKELTEARTAVMQVRDGASLHELIGHWLAGVRAGDTPPSDAPATTLVDFRRSLTDIREIAERAAACAFNANPWADAAGMTLESFLTTPPQAIASTLTSATALADAIDAAASDLLPPLNADAPFTKQAEARRAAAAQLAESVALDGAVRDRWLAKSVADLNAAAHLLTNASQLAPLAAAAVGDQQLWSIARSQPANPAQIAGAIADLDAYLAVATKWWSFLALGVNKRAAAVLRPLGLTRTADNAKRARAFLDGLRARIVIQQALADAGEPGLADAAPHRDAPRLAALAMLIAAIKSDPSLKPVAAAVVAALQGAEPHQPVVDALNQTAARAPAVERLAAHLRDSGAFSVEWLAAAQTRWAAGEPANRDLDGLRTHRDSLENILRARRTLQRLDPGVAAAVRAALRITADPGEILHRTEHAAFYHEIRRRLRERPELHDTDAKRFETLFIRYNELQRRKSALVTQQVLWRWQKRQRDRLLVGTGSRLNSLGAAVKQRLLVRGSRALRLRQVLALGRDHEEGDPLLDLRPVWMASPQTVAQVFALEPQFDIVIFDEASQCRLEEALPVLPRARRVVIAGDPKQLPPTRFFESAQTVSQSEQIETEQELFEAQQSEVDDLLGAALNLDVQQCFLDVHYRSRNSDLISFSNQHFYGSRLVPIPGHPKNKAIVAPITLSRVDGTYDKRTNPAEAQRVVEIVRDLLKRAEPPSIGIGCFNTTQRDEILEALDDAAAEDGAFAAKLAEARSRRSPSGPEGLFVRNLENIQGDERDHIIISTTYGPDPKGKFYRRFGALGMAGGGRRLNVLVTRARHEVHLVTSIPRDVYLSLPPVPDGQTPGGAYLLFEYLRYAERLQAMYSPDSASEPRPSENGTSDAPIDEPPATDDDQPSPTDLALGPTVSEHASRTPSTLARALGLSILRGHNLGSIIHWGNDGFCIDVALRHPIDPEMVTIGVLCDWTRFEQAEDPIEWDLFRSNVLSGQGWTLHRLWSPAIFRDPEGECRKIEQQARQEVDRIRASEAVNIR
ncbi:MAG: AAA domain-containing protein [Phycisphaerales bacterium]